MLLTNNLLKKILNILMYTTIIQYYIFQRKAEPSEFQRAVELGIDAGYRHIDTATMYKNEKEVGAAISNKIKEGLVKREDLFITTKVNFMENYISYIIVI